jgi:hypothetical protein
MPDKHDPLWATCGRRGREDRRTEIADFGPPSSFDATVEGIPVSGTTSLFAGRRSNGSLGRSVELDAGLLPLSRGAPMTADVRRAPRRGTSSASATKHWQPPSMAKPSSVGDASFARSFDPFTSTSWQHRGRKPTVVRRSRRHRGRASLRKRERTDTGVIGNGRCAARRVPPLPQGSCAVRQKRKEVMASVPARIDELGFV